MSTIARATIVALVAATLSPSVAAADFPPDTGTWSVAFHEHTWGQGERVFCEDVPSNTRCADVTLSDTGMNDRVSSYMICNNLGYTATFRVQLYVDANYVNRFTYALIEVDDGECVTKNTVRNDVLSSFDIVSL